MNTNPAWQKTGSAAAERNVPLEIIVVQKDDRKRFDELLGDLHYLGSAKPVGNFLRQAVVRNALLKIYVDHREHYNSLPAFSENLRSDPAAAFQLITRPLRL